MKKNMLIIILTYALANDALMHANFPAAAAAGAGGASKQEAAKKKSERPLSQLKTWYESNFTQLGDQIKLLSYIEGLIRFNHLKIAKAHLKEAHFNYKNCSLDSDITQLDDVLARLATAINKAHSKEGQGKQVLKPFFDIMQKDPGLNVDVTKEINKTLILNIYSIDLLEALKTIIEQSIKPYKEA